MYSRPSPKLSCTRERGFSDDLRAAKSPAGCAQRRADIVAVAQAEFFARGHGTVSMSTIAARAGGSKTTMLTHFPSNYALFSAVVENLIARFAQSLEQPLAQNLPLEEAIAVYARDIMAIVETAEIIALHRVVIAEAGCLPQLVFGQGPGCGLAKLTRHLTEGMAAGRVRPGDPARAASQFIALRQSGGFQDRLWGMPVADHVTRRTADAWSRQDDRNAD